MLYQLEFATDNEAEIHDAIQQETENDGDDKRGPARMTLSPRHDYLEVDVAVRQVCEKAICLQSSFNADVLQRHQGLEGFQGVA